MLDLLREREVSLGNGDQIAVWSKTAYGELVLTAQMPAGATHRGVDVSGRRVEAYLSARPAYCDRGHYMLLVDGPLGLDDDDRFPRYYMDFQRAVEETIAFLNWRLYQIP